MPRYRVWEEGEDRNNAVEIEADSASDAAEEYPEQSDSCDPFFGRGKIIFVGFGSVTEKFMVTASVSFNAEGID